MNVKQITITPTIATNLLKGNTSNRPLRMSHVKHLARLMSEGKWIENGDTICVNGTSLMDGQHRLEAIKLSGVSLKCIVVSDLPSIAFMTKDTGNRRGAGDMLHIVGRTDTSNLASAVNYVYQYNNNKTLSKSMSQKRPSPSEIVVFEGKHPGIHEAMSLVPRNTGLAPFALLVAVYYLFSQKDSNEAATFMHKLCTGDGARTGEPVYFLRERLIKNSASSVKLKHIAIAAFIVKAWNATRNKTPLATFKYLSSIEYAEKFPQIV